MALAMALEAVGGWLGCRRMALVKGERSEGWREAARKEAKVLPPGA